MEDKKITPEELKAAWAKDVDDVDELAEKVATATTTATALATDSTDYTDGNDNDYDNGETKGSGLFVLPGAPNKES